MQQNNNYNDSHGDPKGNETKLGEEQQENDNKYFTEGNNTHIHQFDDNNLTGTQMLTPSKNQNETIHADNINETQPIVPDRNGTQLENNMKVSQTDLNMEKPSQNGTDIHVDSNNGPQKIENGNNQVKPEDNKIEPKSKKGNFISRWWENFKAKQLEQAMRTFRETKAKTQKCIEKYGDTGVYDVDSGKCKFIFNGEKVFGDFPE